MQVCSLKRHKLWKMELTVESKFNTKMSIKLGTVNSTMKCQLKYEQ